jgi:AcrR family transcriptional regulator
MLPMLPANLPKQARSRLTLHRLLSAAEALLEHGGLEAATVPAIAKAAGVSVGVVYRRFPDKDMLLRAVYERFFTTLSEQNLARLSSAGAMQLPLPSLARGIVLGIAEGYRRKRGLLRALSQYAKTHPDPAFRKVAQRMNRATMNAIVALLLSRREEIRHPDPETAIEFGLITVAAVLHAVIIDEERLQGLRAPRNADEELVKMFLAYLETNPASRALRS